MKEIKITTSERDKTREKEEEKRSYKEHLSALMAPALAFAIEHGDLDTIETLLETKLIDLHTPDEDGNQPLHTAATQCDIGVVHLLIEKGASLDVMNDFGRTPLHAACIYGNAEAAKLFIEAGLDVNLKDRTTRSPLCWACRSGHADIVRLLLEHGADVNTVDEDDWTPLHFACFQDRPELVRVLFEAGACGSANVKNNLGKTPLDHVIGSQAERREEIIDLFREYASEMVMEAYCTTEMKL